MHCKVLQLELSKPEPGEFGYLYCKDTVRYISFKEVLKPLSWCLGKNHLNQPIPWLVNSGLFGMISDAPVNRRSARYISNGELDWDEAAVPALGLLEALGLPDLVTFQDIAKLSQGELNLKYSRKLLILGKKLEAETFRKELSEYVAIDNAIQFSNLMSHLAVSRKGNDSHNNKCAIAKELTDKRLKGGEDYERFLAEHFTEARKKNAQVKVKDLIKVSVDEILSFISNNKGEANKRVSFIDVRTVLKNCSTHADDIDSVEEIYLGKFDSVSDMPSNFIIGAMKTKLQAFCLLRNNKGLGTKAEVVIGVDYNIKGQKVQISKAAIPDLFQGKDMLEKVKVHLGLEESKTQGIIRNIPTDRLDDAIDSMLTFVSGNLGLGNATFCILPIPMPLKVSDFLSQHIERVSVSLGKQKIFTISPSFPMISYDHSSLSTLDEVVCNSIWKMHNNTKSLKFTLSNKANIRLEDKREEISQKVAFLYETLEKFLKFQFRGHLGFGKIPRSHIVINNRRGTGPTARKTDDMVIDTKHTFLTISAFQAMKSWEEMEKALTEGGYKNLAAKADIPCYEMSLVPDGTTAPVFNGSNLINETDPTLNFKVNGDLHLIDLSVLRNKSVSALLFQVLLTNSIENEAMLNLDGIVNRLITNDNIIESSLEDSSFTELELMQSIYA